MGGRARSVVGLNGLVERLRLVAFRNRKLLVVEDLHRATDA